MTTNSPRTPPESAPDKESFEQDTKELAKLTTNFYAALNELMPAAIRASKRGKHGLLRLISRKLPRPKLAPAEDPEADRAQDDDAAAIAASVRAVFEAPPPTSAPEPTKQEEKREDPAPPLPKAKPIARPAPTPAKQSRLTSGAPRSINEEPWPGQSNFPRPLRRHLKKRT